MNTPPPRHAPLSLPSFPHLSLDTDSYTPNDIPDDTSDEASVVTPEETDTWVDVYAHANPHADRQTSLARIALASGTGEDVAAFDAPSKRSRIRLDGKPLQALALLLAVVLVGTWGYLWFDGKQLKEQEAGAPTSTTSAPPVTDLEENTTASGDIVAYISGAIVNPGVYTLPAGARVNNLVESAGGLTDDAQTAVINLASSLSDGDHIHIPADGEEVVMVENSGSASAGDSHSGKININTASAVQLEELPGIGPSLAQAIITWREDNGGFTSAEDLLEVSGIGQAKYSKIKDLVIVG